MRDLKKINRGNCRRFSARFGGFFSFRSATVAQKNTFINGVSFFNILRGRGWSFVSYDNFPLDAARLNKLALTARGKTFQNTPLGPFIKFPMFDKFSTEDNSLNDYNISWHYRHQLGQRFVLGNPQRDDEAFKILYNKNKIEPRIIARPDSSLSTSHSVIFDTKQFEISRIFTNLSGGGNLLVSQPDHNTSFNFPDVASIFTRKYFDLAQCINGSVVSEVTARWFYKLRNEHLQTSQTGFVYEARSPRWFRHFFTKMSRAARLDSVRYPSFAAQLNTYQLISDLRREKRARLDDFPANYVANKLFTVNCDPVNLRKFNLFQKYIYKNLGKHVFEDDEPVRRRSLRGVFRLRRGNRVEVDSLISFLKLGSGLNTSSAVPGVLGSRIRGAIRPHFACSKSLNRDVNWRSQIKRSANWALPYRYFVGKGKPKRPRRGAWM